MDSPKLVYLGIKGSIVAVDSATGESVWARSLKGVDFVNVVLDGDNLLAATHGEVFCLDPRTGALRWHNRLKGFGWGLVSIAGAGITTNPMLAMAQKRRRDEASASVNSSATSVS
jgi:outer membrane protein assembly factor BamB